MSTVNALHRRLSLAVAVGLCAIGVSACGGSTVDNTQADPQETIAPLERDGSGGEDGGGEDDGDGKESDKDDDSDEEKSADESDGEDAEKGEDRGAREVEEIPAGDNELTEEDKKFLTALIDEKIDIKGVEYQLIGSASATCKDGDNDFSSAMLKAVSGQLVEQGRTEKKFAEVHKLLQGAAKDAYCG